MRMKDNDLLVTQMFEDPCKEPITALSVYVTSHACEFSVCVCVCVCVCVRVSSSMGI